MCFCMGLHVWLKYWMQLNYVLVLVTHMYLHNSASSVTRNCDCVALNLNWADLTWYLFFINILNFPYISEFSRIIRYGCNVWHKNCWTQSLSEGWLLDVRCSTVEYQFSYPFFLPKPNFVKKPIHYCLQSHISNRCFFFRIFFEKLNLTCYHVTHCIEFTIYSQSCVSFVTGYPCAVWGRGLTTFGQVYCRYTYMGLWWLRKYILCLIIIRSWNNGVRCMSLYFCNWIILWIWYSG